MAPRANTYYPRHVPNGKITCAVGRALTSQAPSPPRSKTKQDNENTENNQEREDTDHGAGEQQQPTQRRDHAHPRATKTHNVAPRVNA